MEGKGARVPLGGVVMIALILGLIAQTHVEAKICCKNTDARNCYNACLFTGANRPTCSNRCDCIIIPTTTCPSGHPSVHYCKLGCASSMCSTVSTPQNSDVGEEALVRCNNICSELCNEGSVEGSNAIFTA